MSRLVRWLLVGLVACAVVGATVYQAVSTQAQADDCPGDADPAKLTGRYPLTLALIDLSDNSPEAVRNLVGLVRPGLRAALNEGGRIKVVVSGGEDGRLRTPRCLDGTMVLGELRDNDTTQRVAVAETEQLLLEDLEAFLRATPVSAKGSATRLLGAAPQQLAATRQVIGERPSEMHVLLYSSLLGNTDSSDCLHVDGHPANPKLASALIARCFAEGQITSFGEGKVRLEGVGHTAETTNQQLMAEYLATALCPRLSDSCALAEED